MPLTLKVAQGHRTELPLLNRPYITSRTNKNSILHHFRYIITSTVYVILRRRSLYLHSLRRWKAIQIITYGKWGGFGQLRSL